MQDDLHRPLSTLGSVSRDPQRVSFAASRLHPVACARLIGDLAVFIMETSGAALAESLREAGFEAEWVRPPGGGEVTPGEVVMELRATTSSPMLGSLRVELKRTLQMRCSALDCYLIELVERDTWVEGMK